MQLDNNSIVNLLKLINTANVCDISSLIIRDNIARGINDNKTCFLTSSNDLPIFSQAIGLSQIKELKNKIELLGNLEDITIEAKETDKNEIMMLTASCRRNKVTHRCQSTAILMNKIPRSVPDALTQAYKISINKNEIATAVSAGRIMNNQQLTLTINDDKSVCLSFGLFSSDTFTINLESAAITNSGKVVQYYMCDSILQILKELDKTSSSVLFLGERGTLSCNINNHTIIILPQIGEENE